MTDVLATRYRPRDLEVEVHRIGDDLGAAVEFITSRGGCADIHVLSSINWAGVRVITGTGVMVLGAADVVIYFPTSGAFDACDATDFASLYEEVSE